MPTRPLMLSFLVLLGACAATPRPDVRIDGSSPATFRSSWSRLNASLSSQQQAQLNGAILILGATNFHEHRGPPEFGPETLRADLDGKDFEAIIAAAKGTGASISPDARRAAPSPLTAASPDAGVRP